MRLYAAAVLFVAVLTVDTITKALAPHSGWTWHDHPFDDLGTANLPMSLLAIAVGLWLTVFFRSIGMAVAVAGVIGNTAWAVLTGGTPNPIVDTTLSIPGEMVAFNVADVAIQGGALWGSVEIAFAVAVFVRCVLMRRVRYSASPVSADGPGEQGG